MGTTFSEHLQNLRDVLNHIREAGLKLKPAKCIFWSPQVEFLGHIVSAQGVQLGPRKVNKVAEWPKPKMRKEVQFLGLANYYQHFVHDFATTAKPLYHLTKKTAPFEWTVSVELLCKEKLTSAPILAFPDFQKLFILNTNASNTGSARRWQGVCGCPC